MALAIPGNVGVGLLFVALLGSLSDATVSVCTVAAPDAQSSWPFDVASDSWHSCHSTNGKTNDMGRRPQMCLNDLASVRIEVTPGKKECLVAHAKECKIPMRDFVSLDYDFSISSCMGIWAAPLWMTPDKWQWGDFSGEIDTLEFCPRDSIHLNFAGFPRQIKTSLDINDSEGHVTTRKDSSGIVTISHCTLAEAAGNNGQCKSPIYTDCNDCRKSSNTFACWCSGTENIYSSGACQNGGNCQYTLVSDIWNGVWGDVGFEHCMSAVPGINLQKKMANVNSLCKFSIENILLRGGGPNGALRWGPGTPSRCEVLTVSPRSPTTTTQHPATTTDASNPKWVVTTSNAIATTTRVIQGNAEGASVESTSFVEHSRIPFLWILIGVSVVAVILILGFYALRAVDQSAANPSLPYNTAFPDRQHNMNSWSKRSKKEAVAVAQKETRGRGTGGGIELVAGATGHSNATATITKHVTVTV